MRRRLVFEPGWLGYICLGSLAGAILALGVFSVNVRCGWRRCALGRKNQGECQAESLTYGGEFIRLVPDLRYWQFGSYNPLLRRFESLLAAFVSSWPR